MLTDTKDLESPILSEARKTDSLRTEIDERYKITSQHYARWEAEAKEDYKFALGDQWTDEDREELKKQNRPCLTFNRIRPLINLITGYQRENSSRIKANPEGGEDRVFSEVMDKGIKFIDKVSHMNYKMGYWFDDGCYCGKSWLEAIITYNKDPIRGELQWRIRTPYQIMPDPSFLEYDLNEGCPFVFKVVKLTKSQLIDLYPEKKTLINGFVKDTDDPLENGSGVIAQEGADDDYGNRPNVTTIVRTTDDEEESTLEKDQKFTVKEYWRIKMVGKYFVINKDDMEPERFDTKKEAEDFIATQQSGKVIERKVPEMWVAAKVCGWILQDDESPFEPYYSGYSFFRFIGDWAPNSETESLRVQGITRPLKDPQREKNKAKSQNLHILNTQANSGWIGDEDALTTERWKKLKQMGSVSGLTIKKKKGSELREILPKGPNVGQLQREEKADEEFKQIVGFNPEFLWGMEGQGASGRAISMRVKNLILSLVRLFSNYRYSKEIVGKFLLEMMPMLFDTKKLMKVLGPEYMRKALDKEKYPQGLNEGHIEAFLQMVKDNKYDVLVTEADQNATIRFEVFQELSELLKAGAPIPITLLIDYMDLPNSEEVKERVEEYQQQQLAAEQSAKAPASR